MANSASLSSTSVRLVHFTFSYPDETPALRDISLEIAAGEAFAVVGPNGAGKSTLLLCLAGLLFGGGEIYIQNQRLLPGNARQVRRQVTLVFQDPDDQLFMPVVEEDVAFGPLNLGLTPEAVQRRVQAALQSVNLWEKRHRPPHHLSQGEKRRAALATALALEPDILLLDEPTSNLDPATRHEIIAHLANLPATRIVSTHDLDLAAALCTRSAVLSGGQLIAVGPTRELINDQSLLRAHRLLPHK